MTTKKQVTRVALVVDKSGSMSWVHGAAVSGLNEQIQTLRANADKGGETFVSLYFFNNNTECKLNQVPASELRDIGMYDYHPNGSTALRDAVWNAMNDLSNIPVAENEEVAYLVVVISDGEENDSRFVTQADLAERIQAYQGSNRWTFTYMLSNSDLSKVRDMGIPMNNVTAYTSTVAGTSDAFLRMASSTTSYLNARSAGITAVANFYDNNTSTVK